MDRAVDRGNGYPLRLVVPGYRGTGWVQHLDAVAVLDKPSGGGAGIGEVAVSTDDGATWTRAALGRDLGPYAFRTWSLALTPGARAIRVRASANDGSTQPTTSRWTPSGDLRNGGATTRVRPA
ncbi:molybdopterin-dependent oxidoreductase [Methylobacterium oryzae CBMB20]